MRAVLRTAGEQIELNCAHRWISGVLSEGAAGQLFPPDGTSPDIRIVVENEKAAFDRSGWNLIARDVWQLPQEVMILNACSSGLDLTVSAVESTLEIRARFRPPMTVRGASVVLRARARLLLRAVLLQYPALWWGQRKGRAPLHASVCSIGSPTGPVVMIAGPGGIGKSTLVNAQLGAGAQSTCDNLCLSDGQSAWGVTEPRRLPKNAHDAVHGRRMPHGRREATWPGRAEAQLPEYLLVLRRDGAGSSAVSPLPARDAARYLSAGTYMAGELRRYWGFAATLSLGTGVEVIHPDVAEIATQLSERLPCLEVVLANQLVDMTPDLLSAMTAKEGIR